MGKQYFKGKFEKQRFKNEAENAIDTAAELQEEILKYKDKIETIRTIRDRALLQLNDSVKYNALEAAIAILEDREPHYVNMPKTCSKIFNLFRRRKKR